jgi:hypothetical protein
MSGKVTYTLDDETVGRIRTLARRSRKPQSQIVREAVAYYAEREDTLTPEERERKLAILTAYAARLSERPRAEVDRELQELRESRRTGWQRPSDPSQ